MAKIVPFKSMHPKAGMEKDIAALPYDVYSSEEAREEVTSHPESFLKLDRGEVLFDQDLSPYDPKVYQAISKEFKQMIQKGLFVEDDQAGFYFYEQEIGSHKQRGLVSLCTAEDYKNQVIKKHEKTREKKEKDRVRHIDALQAHTGPIFLTYQATDQTRLHLSQAFDQANLIFEFTADDRVIHRGYEIKEPDLIASLQAAFADITSFYIADGHHRAASAAKNAKTQASQEAGQFLSVLFPAEELKILSYNRVVKDYNRLTRDQIFRAIQEVAVFKDKTSEGYFPKEKGCFGVYIEGEWYYYAFKKDLVKGDQVVKSLDVSLLQDYVLDPIFNIQDPRRSDRVDFIGGVRGIAGIEKRVKADMAIGFAMYPTSIEELIKVSDKNLLMPPKSTWFEPKLRSGLFIHRF